MKYSGKAFDPRRLPACFGALRATYPLATLEVKKSTETKQGEEALGLLRGKWEAWLPIQLRLHEEGNLATIELRESWDLFYVDIEGANGELCDRLHELVRGALGLVEASEDELESQGNLYAINQRILKLQKMISELPAQLRAATGSNKLLCFVSFRFDEHSKALALELRNFLELAGLEFASGLGYEPRSVSEKVLERLAGKIDLFIVIFSAGGDSAWLHQEIGVAKGRASTCTTARKCSPGSAFSWSLPVMVLREDGTKFDEGLLSDTRNTPRFRRGRSAALLFRCFKPFISFECGPMRANPSIQRTRTSARR